MARIGDTPRARALGAELRDARNSAGLTTRELARRLGHPNNVRVSRWETGHYPPNEADTATVLGVLEVSGAERDRLLDLARLAADPNWLAPGQDKRLAALIEYERTATAITEVNALLIPGLLQTADYARAILGSAGLPLGEAEQRVTLRMGRREILTRPRPATFTALIGEQALRYPPCPAPVALEQIQHLLDWGGRDNITIQVIPSSPRWSPALDGPFVLLEFAKGAPAVHLEHYRSAATITDAGDVRDYKAAADMVRRVAMSPEESSELIAEIADGMEMERTDDDTALEEVQP